jgi:hypothetical protein
LPTRVPLLQNTGKPKYFIGSSHLGSHTVHEYQFLPEQPSDTYERGSQLRFYDALAEVSNSRVDPLNPRSKIGTPQVVGFESSLASPKRLGYHDEDTCHMDRKHKNYIYGYNIFLLLLYYYIHFFTFALLFVDICRICLMLLQHNEEVRL